ncbi:MAG: protein-methionine-sulfoxide reductase catalytic subunit MsrP [Hyphomicrobiales bacterium]|nr:protein-methionine-sulfoxide reductase catalytic subunit MsrP [Hyphomicrobiales bacterium]
MLIRLRKSWELPESCVTPQRLFFNRRAFLAAGAALAAPRAIRAGVPLDRATTPESVTTNYNNFVEFSASKYAAAKAAALKPRPWTVSIGGLCAKPRDVDIDALIKEMNVEERIYRHRCVEAWSMVVPWTGFALKKLVAAAEPKPEAKYIRFESFMDPQVAPFQKQRVYPFPYVEGLTLDEANNDLAFLVTGAYGKPLQNVFGAPLRLATPWKYGFKSIKSIQRISFVSERPQSFWEKLQGDEYGFWANVNPDVPHKRWSQATEEWLGVDGRHPTLLFNGYAQEVAGLYKNLDDKTLFF